MAMGSQHPDQSWDGCFYWNMAQYICRGNCKADLEGIQVGFPVDSEMGCV